MEQRRRFRAFLILWVGQALSLFGSQLVQFALIWWLTKTTGSATILALASVAGLLPRVVLGPFAGVLVDRWPRRTVLFVADSVVALATLLLGVLFWQGVAQTEHVFIILFIRSLGNTFHWPAMEASASLMVPEQHLTRIQGMNQTLNGLLQIGSAPIGALLLEALPMQGIIAIDVVTALFALVPLLFIAIPRPAAAAAGEEGAAAGAVASFWRDFRAGVRYVRGWPALMILIGIATILNFFISPAVALLPVYVTDYFGGDALQLAWMESGVGVGIVAGGLALSVWGGFKRRIWTALTGIIAGGFALLLLGFTPASMFWLAVFALGAFGFTAPIVNGPITAIVQAVVAPEMQGRVFTMLGSLAALMTPLGLVIAGPLADLVDVRLWFIAAGVTNLLIGVSALFSERLLTFEDRAAVEADVVPAATG